jgi:uncharacterized membrane protein YhiD involved in acid resistance
MRNIGLILLAFVVGIVLTAGTISVFRSGTDARGDSETNSNSARNASRDNAESENPFLSVMQGGDAAPASEEAPRSFTATTLDILFRLLLAVILSAVLAFRPRKNFPLFQRNLYVSQTQILLAVVAAALMMIVGDNAARAFAIFAAVSLVRFRTNIRDPKEVTVLLISLALGLAAGVGRWELGIALCGFSLALLWVLEYREQEQAYRSMELTVKTRNIDATQDLLRRIFTKYNLEHEVRKIDPPDEKDAIGNIQYYVNLRLSLSTDHLSEKIWSADPDNLEGIQWSKTKSATDIYQ